MRQCTLCSIDSIVRQEVVLAAMAISPHLAFPILEMTKVEGKFGSIRVRRSRRPEDASIGREENIGFEFELRRAGTMKDGGKMAKYCTDSVSGSGAVMDC